MTHFEKMEAPVSGWQICCQIQTLHFPKVTFLEIKQQRLAGLTATDSSLSVALLCGRDLMGHRALKPAKPVANHMYIKIQVKIWKVMKLENHVFLFVPFSSVFWGKVCGKFRFLQNTSSDLGAPCLTASKSRPIFHCSTLLTTSLLCLRVNFVL